MKVVDIAPALGTRISDVRIDRSGQEEFDEIMRVLLDRHVISIGGKMFLTQMPTWRSRVGWARPRNIHSASH